MKILHTILILLLTISSYAQSNYDESKISHTIKTTVEKIEEVNEVMGSAVYDTGTRPQQWDNFEELKNRASKKELIALTNHPNGVVRSYSFWALSLRRNVDLFSILKDHLTDYEVIKIQFGCIGREEMVGDFFIQIMIAWYIDLDPDEMDAKDMKELDSLLIYQPNKLSSRYDAIGRAELTESLYPKIRELVIEEKNQSALVTLAKYRKEQDVEIIKNFRADTDKDEGGFYFTYVAMQQFPSQEYIPILESNLEKTLDNTHFSTEWRELYKAIASFKNEKAVELLSIPFTEVQHQNIKEYHIEFVFNAILKYQDPIYDDLLWKLWEEENQRTVGSCQYLLSVNPSRAYELVKKELLEDYQIEESDFIPNLDYVEEAENLHEFLLNVVIANDKQLSNTIIREQIEKANVLDLPLFTSKVNRQKIFIEPLFSRLENASNPHMYLNLIKTLIEFNDDDINKRILEVRQRNSNLNEGWGSQALDKLLAQNGIE